MPAQDSTTPRTTARPSSKNYPFDPEAATRFLNALWPDDIPDGHLLSLWTLLDHRTYQAKSISGLVTAASQFSTGTDTYFGVGLSLRVTGRTSRPGKADISLVPAVWLDLDAKHGISMEQLTGYLKTTFEPTITVATGHGLQAYWRLKTPLSNEQASSLLVGFTRFHQKRATFPIDSLIDTSRVLRLPGTWNWKEPEVVPCRLLAASGPSYEVSELSMMVPEEEERPPRPVLPDVLPESGGPYGGRDNTLFKFISNCEHFGFPESWTLSAAHAINRQHFSPPLEDKIVESKVKGTYARYRGAQKAKATRATVSAEAVAKITSLHQEMEQWR